MKILKSKKLITVLAMLLMVATVVGMGTMTYSRYVTSQNFDQQSATVANWGYVLSINSAAMFGSKYEKNAVTTDGDGSKLDVNAAAAVVAPGSSGYMTVDVSGNAEVLAEFTIAVANGYTDVVLKFSDGTEDYYPIVWTLERTVGGNTVTVETGNLSEIVAALDDQSATIAVGASIPLTQYKISWVWDINESTAANNEINLKDTALGMLVAGNDAEEIKDATNLNVVTASSSTTISVQISASIIQIQD